MTTKLKVVLGVLIVLAGFLLTRIGLTIQKSVETASRVRGESTILQETNPLFEDFDDDGIADFDEAYYQTSMSNSDTDGDGYLDGEEIASGFDPTVNDAEKRKAESGNVTENFTDHLVAGVFAGDLNPRNGKDEKYENGLDYLAFATIDEALGSLNPTTNPAALTQSDDSKESQEQYLKTVALLLEGPFLTSFMSQPQTLNLAVSFLQKNNFEEANKTFQNYSLLFTGAYTKLLAISAPPRWINFHANLLETFRKIALNYNGLTKIQEDPLLALAATSGLGNNLALIQLSLIQELKSLLAGSGLELPPSLLFETIGILNSHTQQ